MNRKSIFTILTFEKLKKDPITELPEFGCQRLVGWYEDFNIAIDCVKNNSCDINETCYKYALIEEIPEGLYQCTRNRWLFKYNKENDSYKQIEEPSFMKIYMGFSIG